MELLEVNIEDVYPDESNPRSDFGDIEALAASFDLNPERPGEPFTPPILVRDGGIYRIIDGERRYRALKERGATRFSANVCSGMDEADSVVAMLATDDKMQLSDLERSRGVQKMLLLGVDPVKVDTAARMQKGSADRVATAMAIVDDAGEDMTLDRMLAVAEFADEPGTVDKLMNASEKDWAWEADRARTARKRRAQIAEMQAKAAELGIELLADEDTAARAGYRYAYHLNPRTPEDLEANHAEEPDAIFTYTKHASFYGYLPQEEPAEAKHDPEAEARAKALAELGESFNASFAAIKAYFTTHTMKVGRGTYPHIADLCADAFKSAIEYDEVTEAFPVLEDENVPLSRWDYAIGYAYAFPWEELSLRKVEAIRDKGLGSGMEWYIRDVPDIADLFAAAEADGFVFDETNRAAKEAVEACVAFDGEQPEGGE